jgi:hypothetical protein
VDREKDAHSDGQIQFWDIYIHLKFILSECVLLASFVPVIIDVIKVKVKLSLYLAKHHAIKTYWGSGGIVPRILDLGNRWR